MEIIKLKEDGRLTVSLDGRLDTNSAPALEEMLRAELDGVNELIFDFKKLVYISSAGLRIVLSAQKTMNKQGKMIIRNVCSDVLDIFEITGFADILTIE